MTTADSSASDVLSKIKYVIVLMMENRSFDHMLGMLKKNNAEINGCLASDVETCTNHVDPADSTSTAYTVDDTAVYEQNDPHHSISGTSQQIYGKNDGDTSSPQMSGFIASYADEFADGDGSSIMKCFAPEHVPAITSIAQEFAVFDGYHASVPGPTEPNRAYAISATSHGMGTNDVETMVRGLPQKTIFRQVEEMGLDYRIYLGDAPACIMFKDLRHKDARKRYRFLKKSLYDDLAAGDMPDYTWIEPAYFDGPGQAAADQHPAHDVSVGDQLIKDIYEAVRSSPIWNETAFIITYDEHGGFYDHVPPPQDNVPNPDGLNDDSQNFTFNRLGVRVPFVVASPWVKKGTVVHAAPADGGQYEHSSIVSTVVHKLLKPVNPLLKPKYLTKRDEWAATFEGVFDTHTSTLPRTDCPKKLPDVPAHRLLYPDSLPPLTGHNKLTDFQKSIIVSLAGAVDDRSVTFDALADWTEAQAGTWSAAKMREFVEGEETSLSSSSSSE